MKHKMKTSTNVIQAAIEATPDIANAYQPGLRALGAYSGKVVLSGTCEGSVDIDAAVTTKYPTDSRWDYAIGYKAKIYFVEVHSAQTGEVSFVLKKLKWLKGWLSEHAAEMEKHKGEPAFTWIQSGSFRILKGSPQYRLAE
jgi:hypothetical protein